MGNSRRSERVCRGDFNTVFGCTGLGFNMGSLGAEGGQLVGFRCHGGDEEMWMPRQWALREPDIDSAIALRLIQLRFSRP